MHKFPSTAGELTERSTPNNHGLFVNTNRRQQAMLSPGKRTMKMKNKRLGDQTIKLENPPVITASCAVGGKKEGEGPLAGFYDYLCEDSYFGAESWEAAESEMLKKCFDLTLAKKRIAGKDLDMIFSGDLLNQCVGSAFAISDSGAPYFGLYGACSTMAESIALGAMAVDGGFAQRVCALTSSHFCSAERQFRLPLCYGGQQTPTAQWTATAAGAVIIEPKGKGPAVTHLTIGKIVDAGISDPANMGAAMAPAALDTLCTHFVDTGRQPDYYDLIVTGDLGFVGFGILTELAAENGYDLAARGNDCGLLIYDRIAQKVKAGGSGCGCSASVLAGYLLDRLEKGEINKLLFAATGALMSPTTALQGKSVMGICHAVAIENEV